MAQTKVYQNSIVESYQISTNCITNLSSIVAKDYGKDYDFPKNVKAIDLDLYEASRLGTNQETMDAAIGIADYNNCRLVNERLILVEFRLDYSGKAKNSTTTEMKKKEKHSRDLLSDVRVDNNAYFIFVEGVYEHKRNEISRLSNEDSTLKNWVVCSPKEFLSSFFHIKNLPYVPISPIEEIEKCCESELLNKEYTKLIKRLVYWLGKSEYYFVHYNLEEVKEINKMIEKIINIIDINDIKDEDCELDFEILKENIWNLKTKVI